MGAARPRLTPHQRDVLAELTRRSRAWDGAWIAAEVIGSPAALGHLVDKGYAERSTSYGPRGGEQHSYRPVTS